MKTQKISLNTPYAIGKVHLYSAELNGELVLFDTGPATEESLACLRKELPLEQLKYVFITHWHPEHCGLAHYLSEEYGTEVVISTADAHKLHRKGAIRKWLIDYLHGLGLTADAAKTMVNTTLSTTMSSPHPSRYRVLEESSDLLDQLGLRFIHARWHSQSDVVYLLGDQAIVGDAVVDNILSVPLLDMDYRSPKGARFDNYGAFCRFVSRLAEHREFTLMPSHHSSLESVDSWILCVAGKILRRAQELTKHFENNTFSDVVDALWDKDKNEELVRFLKISEMVFINDFLNSPEILLNTLKETGFYSNFEGFLEEITIRPLFRT